MSNDTDSHVVGFSDLPYFSGYKTVFFPFKNNPKYLDPSYKTDLHIWDCFRRKKTNLKAELNKINLGV